MLGLLAMLAAFLDDPAPMPEPADTLIRYTVRFPEPHTHYAEIEAELPTGGADAIEVYMPVWTPGSYLVREFARHVEGVAATGADGASLAAPKVRKNRWRIETGGADRVTVTYRLYGREMGVQTNWIDADFALLNGAATFLTLADSPPRPHAVKLVLPPGWLRSFTGLKPTRGGPHGYIADDYDELVDCPIYAGNPAVYEFEVDGKPHFLVNEGEGGVWDGPRSARDVEAIVRAQREFWGFLPYDKYIFFNLLTENGGGLEHKNSTVLMSSRWATRRRADYLNWLNLVSHEYFHTWNVKRLRPVELGPFDYEREVHTKSLWVAEGITSYYDRLFVRRAGLCTVAEYLAGDPPRSGGGGGKNDIGVLMDQPGRLVQPLETSSFDAWIKLYRRDENSPNTSISYYTKGAVVGFLLDAQIRRATDGSKSLDDLMRLLYERYSGEAGYTPEQFRQAAEEVAGADLDDFFRTALESTDELDYDPALSWFGLRFKAEKKAGDDDEDVGKPARAWLGLSTRADGGRLIVTGVKRGTPGLAAGFNVDDEILAIGDDRLLAADWSKRMEQYRPNETVSVLVSRRGRLRRLEATLGAEPGDRWNLEIDPDAGDEAKVHRRAWLGSPSDTPEDEAAKPEAETPKTETPKTETPKTEKPEDMP